MPEHMPNHALQPTTALGGRTLNTGSVSIYEVTERALVSLAFKASDREHVSAVLGGSLPAVGSSLASHLAGRLLGLQIDQTWCLIESTDSAMDKVIARKLSDTRGIYLTDQSDAWTILALSGDTCRQVLERLCPLDLDESVFPIDAVARTVIEHTGVIILRTGRDSFELITPRSSTASFMHAIETVVEHVRNEIPVRSQDRQQDPTTSNA